MAPKIGIKLADGAFLPIIDEMAFASEVLELTTVHDNQQNVQINLFKREDESLEPHYIGSLIIENIEQKKAGEPTLELHLMLDDAKQLSAKVIDIDSGSTQTLQVSLGTLDDNIFDDADFSLNMDNSFTQDRDDIILDTSFSDTESYADDLEFEDEKKRRVPLWLLVLGIVLGIGILVLIGMLFMKKKSPAEQAQKTQSSHTERTIVEEAPIENTEQEAPSVIESPSQQQSQRPPQKELPPDTVITEPPTPNNEIPSSNNAEDNKSKSDSLTDVEMKEPAVSSKTKNPQSVRYKLRWGDTLWDISETYYRNPWLYKEIAEHNKLTNPDIIISGTYIEIPPK